jgi:hypothetical protein
MKQSVMARRLICSKIANALIEPGLVTICRHMGSNVVIDECLGDLALIEITTDQNGVLYEQVTDVNSFSLLGLLLLRLLLLSTGFVFAL